MRLVLLTGNGPEHQHVSRKFAQAFPEELQAVVIARPRRESAYARIRRYSRRYTLPEIGSRLLARGYARASSHAVRRRKSMADFFRVGLGEEELPHQLVRSVASHNGSEGVELVRSLEPDVIAVYGTAIIRAPIIRLASQAILNMHTGISPRYRGSNTVFWPLHNSEPEWIGVTVHHLTEGIDAGPILEIGRPTISKDDDEHTLFCKCVLIGSELYVRAVQNMATGTSKPRPQDLTEGRQYRFVDRTMGAELRVRRLLARGLLRRFAEQGR